MIHRISVKFHETATANNGTKPAKATNKAVLKIAGITTAGLALPALPASPRLSTPIH